MTEAGRETNTLKKSNANTWPSWVGAGIRWFLGLGATFLTTLGLSAYPPPKFESSGSTTISLVGVAFVFVGYFAVKQRKNKVRLGATIMAISLLFQVPYFFLLDSTTAVLPGRACQRLQIGFGMAEWSLTDKAQKMAARGEVATPIDLLQSISAWGGGGQAQEMWKQWSIWLAAAILHTIFLLAVIGWGCGLGITLRSVKDRWPSRSSPQQSP